MTSTDGRPRPTHRGGEAGGPGQPRGSSPPGRGPAREGPDREAGAAAPAGAGGERARGTEGNQDTSSDEDPADPDPQPENSQPESSPPESSPPAGGDPGTIRRGRPPRSDRSGASPVPPAATEPDPPTDPPTVDPSGRAPAGAARRSGRHARPDRGDAGAHTPPPGYRPRHAAPDVETERFERPDAAAPSPPAPSPPAPRTGDDGVETPMPGTRVATLTAPEAEGTARSSAVPTAAGAEVGPSTPLGERVRVVLAERRLPTRAVRTVAEVEQQTETGEFLLGNLLRAQLTLGVRLGLVAVLLMGSLPILFLTLPSVGEISVLGIRLPWLLLGLAPYPFMLLLGWLYTWTAERNELDFADNVED